MASICYLWGLVCLVLASWSVPKMVSNQPWDISWQACIEVSYNVAHGFFWLLKCSLCWHFVCWYTYSNVSGMIERESRHSWLPLMSSSVQWIHWRNLHWSRPTLFCPFLLWITLSTKCHAMFLMMVQLCWHLSLSQKPQNLLESGFPFVRSTILNQELQNFTLLKK